MSERKDFVKNHKYAFIIIMALVGVVACLGVFYIIWGVVDANGERTYKDTVKIVKKEFDCDEILWMGSISDFANSPVICHAGGGGGEIYVIAKKGDEQIFACVPMRKTMKPGLIDWPLEYTYEEIVNRVNNAFIEFDLPENHPRTVNSNDVNIYTGEHFNNIDYDRLDVAVEIEIYIGNIRNLVTQENNKLMLYNSYTGDEGMEI